MASKQRIKVDGRGRITLPIAFRLGNKITSRTKGFAEWNDERVIILRF